MAKTEQINLRIPRKLKVWVDKEAKRRGLDKGLLGAVGLFYMTCLEDESRSKLIKYYLSFLAR